MALLGRLLLGRLLFGASARPSPETHPAPRTPNGPTPHPAATPPRQPPDAPPRAIREAYRGLMREVHPDLSADEDSTEFAALLNEARGGRGRLGRGCVFLGSVALEFF